MTKACIGCQATCGKDPIEVFHNNEIKRCPCLSCIVKPICTDICFDYYTFETLRRKWFPKNTVIKTAYRKVPKEHYMAIKRLNEKTIKYKGL